MRLEAAINDLLSAQPELAETPLGKLCAEFRFERQRLTSRLERISRISDGYQGELRQVNRDLVATNERLESALADVRTLRGFIPVCSQCKKVRDDGGFWDSVENYLSRHSDAVLGSSVCPVCAASNASSASPAPVAIGDEAEAEQRNLIGILGNPDWREHPLRGQYEHLSARFQKLSRRLRKISRISDGFQSQLKAHNVALAAVSRTDPLTGVANRRAMLDWLDDAAVASAHSEHGFSVAMVDIDFFKRINDSFGHAAGDYVLRSVASVLVAQKGDADFVARWGGEEFLLLITEGEARARQLCERIRAEIEALRIGYGGRAIRCSVSIGVAEHEPTLSCNDTIRDADRALYAAKSTGRNAVIAAGEL